MKTPKSCRRPIGSGHWGRVGGWNFVKLLVLTLHTVRFTWTACKGSDDWACPIVSDGEGGMRCTENRFLGDIDMAGPAATQQAPPLPGTPGQLIRAARTKDHCLGKPSAGQGTKGRNSRPSPAPTWGPTTTGHPGVRASAGSRSIKQRHRIHETLGSFHTHLFSKGCYT